MSFVSDADLMALALEAREKSYSPYSHFAVGAALVDKNGNVYQGCNIENAAYSACVCAERSAFFKAVSSGVTSFEKIAIVGGKAGEKPTEVAAPCGVCRQVMSEFCDDSFKIILAKSETEYITYTLDESLPLRFSPKNLLG